MPRTVAGPNGALDFGNTLNTYYNRHVEVIKDFVQAFNRGDLDLDGNDPGREIRASLPCTACIVVAPNHINAPNEDSHITLFPFSALQPRRGRGRVHVYKNAAGYNGYRIVNTKKVTGCSARILQNALDNHRPYPDPDGGPSGSSGGGSGSSGGGGAGTSTGGAGGTTSTTTGTRSWAQVAGGTTAGGSTTQAASGPDPVVVNGREEFEVESICTSRLWYGKLQYRVRWAGWGHDDTWYPASNFKNSPGPLYDYHSVLRHEAGPPRRLQEWGEAWLRGETASPHDDDDLPTLAWWVI